VGSGQQYRSMVKTWGVIVSEPLCKHKAIYFLNIVITVMNEALVTEFVAYYQIHLILSYPCLTAQTNIYNLYCLTYTNTLDIEKGGKESSIAE
jgi:hypothetical protein